MRLSLAVPALVARLFARAVALGRPAAVSTQERLRSIALDRAPVEAPVDIRWDRHQVPSIRAESGRDLAVALGVVHAHLRLAQMELMRRLARGRVAEVIGQAGVPLDRTLRLMQFDAAVPAMLAGLPAATREWAGGFVAGVNHHLVRAPSVPYEFRLLRVEPEPWTVEDVLLVGRLVAADVSWMLFGRLLRAREGRSAEEWDRLWPELLSGDLAPWAESRAEAAFGFVRGSNSAAVSARLTRNGAGLIASDPHLPITQPPVWLIAGLHAPGLDVVGLMPPGLPLVALGRSAHLAWGGTNLHAASSELIDVSAEPIATREERIPVRGRAPVSIRLRETRFGPVVSDGLLIRSKRPLALRWVGHAPSDELSAMLGVMRARSLEEFRAALGSFAVPGQTMVAVEAGPAGRAGRVIAAHLPRRTKMSSPHLICAPADAWGLDDLVRAADFPGRAEEIVVSANDRPEETPVPVGFFFSPPDRARRIRELLSGARPVTAEAMRALQRDVMGRSALALRDRLLPSLPSTVATRVLADWDGAYRAGSPGALVFEALVAALSRRLIGRRDRELLAALWTGRALTARRIADAPRWAVRGAARAAARVRRRHGTWGGAHRMALRHPFAALPGLRSRFTAAEYGADGGNDTVNKSSHGLVRGRHRVGYGACARHVSDMSDPDANWLVLLGGQDGWLGSANLADQVPLWRKGEAILVPLRHEATASWRFSTRLTPA